MPHAALGRAPRPAAVVAAALLAGAGCGGGSSPEPGPRALSAQARAYVEAALDTMQRYSINKKRINWPAFRAAAVARAGAAQTPAETHASLAETVRALGDNHSQFYPPSTFARAAAAAGPVAARRLAADPAPTPTTIPSGRLLDGGIGYVFVPAFSGANARGRADSTLAVVRVVDAAAGAGGACGWVVDLRLNRGGNMYPMVAGLGPLLGDGRAGVFVDPDSVRIDWYHRAGVAGTSSAGVDYPAVSVSAPYTLRRPGAPVAVLYGPFTASSGEAAAISFRGLPNARSFGTPTYGLSTANQGFLLSDGALLNLTVAVQGDRTGRLYGGPVPPDEAASPVTPDPTASAPDVGMQAAMQWLRTQPGCLSPS